jgi:TIR domain
MPTVFLSYARADAEIVDKIANDLKTEGINVWLDRERLKPGDLWASQIEEALKTADVLIFFISKASVESKWVNAEFTSAFSKLTSVGGTRIIPVLLEEVSKLPLSLAHIQYADFTKSYYAGMRTLLSALKQPSGPKPDEFIDSQKLAQQIAGEVAKILGIEKHDESSRTVVQDSTLVFVITAFHPDLEPIFEGIAAAAKSTKLVAKRVKDVEGDFRITDKIISMIESARLIVADLTFERPNVYFELGYARGLGKTVVTIAKQSTNVHFDVKGWVYIEYSDSRVLEEKLKTRFEHELSSDTSKT